MPASPLLPSHSLPASPAGFLSPLLPHRLPLSLPASPSLPPPSLPPTLRAMGTGEWERKSRETLRKRM